MMLYLLLIPLLVLQLHTWWYLRITRQNDRVLFQFCDFRRELMTFLRTDQAYDLNLASYNQFRMLLETTNLTVHHFRRLRPTFNFRRTWKALRAMAGQMNEQESQIINSSVMHPQIDYFAHRMLACWGTAFFAYTPFLRHEMLLALLHHIAGLFKKAGVARMARLLEELRSMANVAMHSKAQQPYRLA